MIKIADKFADRKVSPQTVKFLIRRLSVPQRIKLLEDLERETWAGRIGMILKNVDRRRKAVKMSARDIKVEIERARRDFYARSH